MRGTSTGTTSSSRTLRGACLAGGVMLTRRLAVGLLGVLFAVALPAAAQANNLFTLDSHADTTGPIVTESSGTGYVAWDHPAASPSEPNVVLFCKIPRGGTCTAPIALPLPAGTFEEIVQPFPVLGSHSGVVYVVGPRYVRNDTLIWTSTDGGATFSSAKVGPSPGGYPDKTGVGDVLLDPSPLPGAGPTEDYFGIAANNYGLGFGFTANEIISGTTSFTFANPGAGGVASSTLGYLTKSVTDPTTHQLINPEVEAYYNLSNPYEVFFYRYANNGSADGVEAGWEGPFKVSDGYVPRLAGGPKGLFMLSTDIATGESTEAQPSAIDVRKFNETTHTFEAPVMIATIPTSASTLFNSGDIYENPETGYLYVAEPVIDSEGNYVMRLWESTDAGQTFHGERNIAAIGFAYSEIPRLAVAADGQGWLTFKDAGGLEVADLSAIPAPKPPPPPPTTVTVTTSQTSGTTTGANIPIPAGTVGETDQAILTGAHAATATGTVAYGLYTNSSCTGSAVSTSSETVTVGKPAASAPVTAALVPGAYYWKAAYSGDANNFPSASACGSEVLTVGPPAQGPKAGEGATSTSTTVTVTITCSGPCTVTITITVPTASAARKSKKKPKPLILAKGTFTLRKGGTQKLTLHLTKTGRKVFAAHHGRLKVSLLLSEKIGGHTVQSTKTIKIVPAKHKRKK